MSASESNVQSRVRVVAASRGWRIWRNNSGAGVLENGSFVRWGLGNDSTAVNSVMKSADLIGVRRVTITADMVGKVIGQFVALECKREGWTYSGDDEEHAQKQFLDFVNENGGYAMFVADPAAF